MSNNNTPAMPSRDSVTQYQVASLLGVIKQLENLAMFRPEEEEDFSAPAGRNIDGGTYDAVTTTIINACATLDTILLDANRWKIELHDELYQSMLRTQSAAVSSLKAQEETFKSAGTPAALFKPALMVNGEEFIAHWGQIESGYAVMGRGKTPAAALADFNLAFLRTPKEMLDQITDLVAEANFKPKKKRKSDEI